MPAAALNASGLASASSPYNPCCRRSFLRRSLLPAPARPCRSNPHRDTALREAPTLLRKCTALLEAGPGPGSGYAPRELYENAFTVMTSYIQHPQHGKAMAESLVDDACKLVMRDVGPPSSYSTGLHHGSSQSVYRWGGRSPGCVIL